jgi:thiol:disulfide interchange protein DsbD
MAALLVTALAARLWGEAQARGGAGAWRAAGALALAAAVPIAATALARDAAAPYLATAAATADDPFWSPWSPEREDALRAAGQPVFVNYTAAWCLTCQVNERLVFADDTVREAFRRTGVTALKADWTDRSDTIAASLDRHGRSGVPLYVLHAGGPEAPAEFLPQLPTRAEMIRAVEAAAPPQPTEESS